MVRSFWKTIWDRTPVDRCAALRFWDSHVPQSVQRREFVWKGFQAQQLQALAQEKCTTAGCDGWTSVELHYLPLNIWEDVAYLFDTFVSEGRAPRCMQEIRQALIPKDSKTRSDGAVSADALRPISVLSIWWRLFSSCIARSVECREWQLEWRPRFAHGGFPEHGVHTALLDLEASYRNLGILVSLDLAKGFDYLQPEIALECMARLGFPEELRHVLASVWSSQSRWIGIGQHFDPEPQRVHSSLPQRDALAPLAFNAVMLGPCHALHKQKWPQEVLVTYIDDRTYTATTWQRAADLREAWREAVEIVGLRENGHKVKALCRGPKQRETAESVGFSPGQLVHTIRVLGLDFSKVNASPSGDARLAQATARAVRISVPHAPYRVKRQLARRLVMPLATWGWWFHHLSENRVRALKGAIKHALRWSPLASVDLLAVLGGHDLDPWVHRADARWSPSASMWRSQKVPRNWEYTHVQGGCPTDGLGSS